MDKRRHVSPPAVCAAAGCVLLGLTSCGGSNSPTTPSGTTNKAPAISVASSAIFGIAQLSTFTFTSSASDPDGDPVTVAWNFGDGTAASGVSASHVFGSGGTFNVVATASDGKGGSTPSANIPITVGGMTGTWSGSINLNFCLPGVTKPSLATLTQSGGTVTGSVTLGQGLCSFAPGTAITDPAEPGTISAAGAVRIRVKIPPFTDVYFQGQMDSTGRTITGGLVGSGHNGTPFVWTKQ